MARVMPKFVNPSSISPLTHVSSKMHPSPSQRFVLAASVSGKTTMFSEAAVTGISLEQKVYSTSPTIDDEGKYLGFIGLGTGRLWIHYLETRREAQVEPDIEMQDCCFDEDGHLWTIRITGEEFVLEQRRAGDWVVQRETRFRCSNPRFSGARLWQGGAPGRVIIRTFDRQTYLGTFDAATGQVSTRCLVNLNGEHFPIITSVSGELISLDHDNFQVVRMAWPFEEILGTVDWPRRFEDKFYDERPGFSACYLDLVHVLVTSTEGRLFLLHTRSMEFVDEIHVRGFEPFPPVRPQPQLPGSPDNRISNLSAFGRCGDMVVMIFVEGTQAQAAYIPVSEFL